MSESLRLPELPEGWVWSVAMSPYGGNEFSAELIDGTQIGKLVFWKGNSAEFKVGGRRYEQLLARGVHAGIVRDKNARGLLRKARRLAEKAWLVESTRRKFDADLGEGEGPEPLGPARLTEGTA